MKRSFVLIILSIFIFIAIILIFILILKPRLSGNVLLTTQAITDEKEYSYTKAICNESNFCQDYEIKCKNKTLISSSPITGAVIQHELNWQDPRENKELCE